MVRWDDEFVRKEQDVRTTLDVEEDVLMAAKEMARQHGVSTGKILSELARQALTHGEVYETRNGVPLFPIQPDAGVVTSELVYRLLDE